MIECIVKQEVSSVERKTTIKKKILYCIFFCVLLYFAGSVYISLRIESLIVAANAVSPVENPSPETISDENFRRLGYKNTHSIRWNDSPCVPLYLRCMVLMVQNLSMYIPTKHKMVNGRREVGGFLFG